MKDKSALVMVDVQKDFCEGGSLAVPDADRIVPLVNDLQACFEVVIATKDWHPKDHMSFASLYPGRNVGDVVEMNQLQQVLWPDHCVQDSAGAEFHPDLHTDKIQKCFYKGIDKTIDSYSAFFDNAHQRSTGLADYLLAQHVSDVYILGLATDYCVKFSCIDAVRSGFKTYMIEDACRGVNLNPTDTRDAIQTLQEMGVIVVQAKDILQGQANGGKRA